MKKYVARTFPIKDPYRVEPINRKGTSFEVKAFDFLSAVKVLERRAEAENWARGTYSIKGQSFYDKVTEKEIVEFVRFKKPVDRSVASKEDARRVFLKNVPNHDLLVNDDAGEIACFDKYMLSVVLIDRKDAGNVFKETSVLAQFVPRYFPGDIPPLKAFDYIAHRQNIPDLLNELIGVRDDSVTLYSNVMAVSIQRKDDVHFGAVIVNRKRMVQCLATLADLGNSFVTLYITNGIYEGSCNNDGKGLFRRTTKCTLNALLFVGNAHNSYSVMLYDDVEVLKGYSTVTGTLKKKIISRLREKNEWNTIFNIEEYSGRVIYDVYDGNCTKYTKVQSNTNRGEKLDGGYTSELDETFMSRDKAKEFIDLGGVCTNDDEN